MTFDWSLDKVFKQFDFKDDETGKGLKASVNQYNNGPLKFQIGPRTYITKNGDERVTKVGRLSKEELEWLLSIGDEALDFINYQENADTSVDD